MDVSVEKIVNILLELGFEWGEYWDDPDYPSFQMAFGQEFAGLYKDYLLKMKHN